MCLAQAACRSFVGVAGVSGVVGVCVGWAIVRVDVGAPAWPHHTKSNATRPHVVRVVFGVAASIVATI